MAEFPALPLWTDAYLADTRHLSTLEHGAYLLLLMEAWRRPTCCLPNDDALLCRLAGVDPDAWEAMRPVILAFFKLDKRSKTLSQKRLKREHVYVREKSMSQRSKAERRWKIREKANAAALPKACRSDAPTPTPTPTPTNKISDTNVSSPELIPDHVVEAWNEMATRMGLPLVKRVSAQRKAKLGARIKEHPIADWQEALNAIERNPWMHGDNDRGWRADFDFLLQPASFQKLIEGSYDRKH